MREKIRGAVAIVLCSLFCCDSAAFADGDSLVLSLGLKEEYNDNIFFTDEEEVDDFITTVSPGIELRRKYERVSASLKGLLDASLYSENSDLNDVDQNFNGDFLYLLTQRLSFSAGASYLRDSRPDREIDETGLVLGTDIRKRQHYNAGMGYKLTEITNANFTYAYDREDFDRLDSTDYNSHIIGLGLTHDLNYWLSSTTGRMNFGYGQYDYSTSDIDYYKLTIGAERQWTEIYSYYFDIGGRVTHSEFDSERTDDDSTGGVVKLGMRYKGELTRGNLFFSHDVGAASGRNGTTERTSVVFLLHRRFAEKLSGSLQGGYYLNKSDRGELAIDEIDERTVRITPRISYEFSRYFSLEGAYAYAHIKDKADCTSRERNQVFVRLVFEYPLFQ